MSNNEKLSDLAVRAIYPAVPRVIRASRSAKCGISVSAEQRGICARNTRNNGAEFQHEQTRNSR